MRFGVFAIDWVRRYIRGTPSAVVPPAASRTWHHGLTSEVGFWERWVAGDIPAEWREQRKQRLAQDQMRFPVHLEEELGPDAPATVRVLDVGAGPISTVGLAWPGHVVDLVAVDPLAETYEQILREAGVAPRVPTIPGVAESLTEMFPPASFDVVYCQNALDHSSDPLAAIRQMLAVTKSTGFVYLTHAENEAESQHYLGLHQWNITVEDNSLVIWGKNRRFDVAGELGSSVNVTASRPNPGWIVATVRQPAT